MLIPNHPIETNRELPNTRIEYLYRDAANWKQHNECVVPGRFTDAELDAIMASLDDGENFVPETLGMPETRFGRYTDDDGPYFELSRSGFVPTAQEPTLDIPASKLAARFTALKGHWLDGEI